MNSEPCWHCGEPAGDSLFCRFCDRLQHPAADYFHFFGLEPRLSLDLADLQQRYYSLSRRLHPDRFQRGTPQERQFSLEATAILNDGYRTLRDPVARAEYVLRREGFSASRQAPPELLEEVFELNMAAEEGDREQAHQRLAALRDQADADLLVLFEQHDREPGREILSRIRAVLDRRRLVGQALSPVEKTK